MEMNDHRCPACGSLEYEAGGLEALNKECTRLRDRIEKLRGAMAADDHRLEAAAARVGEAHHGCDAPDWMADRILFLRAEVDRLKNALRRIGDLHDTEDGDPDTIAQVAAALIGEKPPWINRWEHSTNRRKPS